MRQECQAYRDIKGKSVNGLTSLSTSIVCNRDKFIVCQAARSPPRTRSGAMKVDWAAQFGMVTDKFGVPWMILGLE